MFDQATIDANIERIKAVPYSQACMKPGKGRKLSVADQKATDSWKHHALGFWAKQQKELDDGSENKKA